MLYTKQFNIIPNDLFISLFTATIKLSAICILVAKLINVFDCLKLYEQIQGVPKQAKNA